ncbi:hypothetical protein ACJQWK_01432 [Exserohilum turcicum]
MLTYGKAMAILAFTGAVIAKPLPESGATFSLESNVVVRAPKHQLEHIVNIKRRLGVEVHPELAEAANKAAAKRNADLAARKVTGTASGRSPNPYDTEFVYPIRIGGTTFKVIMDTASSDTWVYSSAQPANQTVGHHIYQINPAHKKPGVNFTIGYDGASSQVEGDAYVEPITIGGITAKSTFGAASTAIADWTSDLSQDGVVGLGIPNFNQIGGFGKEKTWFVDAIPMLDKPLFAVAHTKGHGVYDFGFINQKKISGPITWVWNRVERYWDAYGFLGDGFGIGDPSAQITKRKMKIHLEAGTDISFTDPDIVKAWYSLIPGAVTVVEQGYTIPCNSKPPGWTVTIRGRKFFTPGCALISQPVDDEGKNCLGGLQNIGGGVDFSLFGINFHKGKYIIQDYTDPNHIKLGFAMQPGSK